MGVLVMVVDVPDTVTGADAIMLVAPAESILAALMLTVAMPLEFVRAVAEAGVNVTRPLVAAKDTTVPGTADPPESLTVALAVTGVPYPTTLAEMPRETEGVPVVSVLLPLFESPLLPHPTRQQNKTREISRNKSIGNFALIDFTMLLSLCKSTDDIFLIFSQLPETIVVFNLFYTVYI
jgi:hypothetical protein